MKIALIGFYGHENPGDERILHCVRRLLEKHEVIPINGFAGMRSQSELVNSCDHVFFGGGGVVQRGTGVHAPLFEALRPPLACLGISVEAVHDDNRALLRVLEEKSSFILVRDQGSALAFGPSPKVVVGPDLTFLYPWPVSDLKNDATNVCGLNLLPWHWWSFQYKGRADKWLRRLARKFPVVERLYPFPRWNPARAVEIVRREFRSVLPLPFYHEPGQPSDGALLRRFFGRVEDAFSSETMAACGTLVAMRLHAAIFACQMGIPFISLAYQPKVGQFCRAIAHERYCVSLFRPAELQQAITALRESHRDVREHLLTAREESHARIHVLIRGLLGPMVA